MIEDLDSFLAGHNFKRAETDWCGKTWGDVLYTKNSN